MIEDKSVSIDMTKLDLTIIVFEANLVENLKQWWVDIAATQTFPLTRSNFQLISLLVRESYS